MKRLRVGVIYGGRSGEHEVSIASAAAVIANLDRARYEPIPIRIEKDGRWTLPDRPPATPSAAAVIEQARAESSRAARHGREAHLLPRPGEETLVALDREAGSAVAAALHLDVIFPVLHGPYGEDGTVQGLLELAGVPYVGAGVLASAVGMDKPLAKTVFRAAGLPVGRFELVLRRDWRRDPEAIAARLAERVGFPMFVKPANLGSSVGVSKVSDPRCLATAMDLAAEFDRRLIVEAAVPDAREIECAVLGNDDPEASVPGEILPAREFYDYEAKYLDTGSQLLVPAPLDPDLAETVRRYAVAAFRAIDCAGMARVDFLLSRRTGELVIGEINTIPGFTTISMYARLWEASGLAYPALLDRLIALALERHAEKQALRTSR
ncbi:MAG TPA: D-alanine--D-alanine ligase family protein [Vicinamibacterales bacterium]|nr:D-alanine--D-alanine ligase family protein [Vicinamibacterales bacterium]